jgi:hypothetical protein
MTDVPPLTGAGLSPQADAIRMKTKATVKRIGRQCFPTMAVVVSSVIAISLERKTPNVKSSRFVSEIH